MQPWDFILLRERYRALKLQGILDAPLNLLVTCDRRRGGPHVLGRFTMRHMDEYSTCLAVQNLWLAARAEGLGVGWMSLLEPEFIAELLALPDGVVPVAYLTLGYPVSFPDEPMLQATGWAGRRPLDELIFVDRYGQLQAHGVASPDSAQPLLEDGQRGPESDAPDFSADEQAWAAPVSARARQDELTKPRGSLGRLEALGLTLAGLQQREYPSCRAPSLLLFAGDHGIADEGVSAYLPQATTQMVYQYLSGAGAVNVLCRQHGVDLRVADVGVDHDFGRASGLFDYKVRRSTRNFLREAAMTHEEMGVAIAAGGQLVAQFPESEVIGLGEMGIGNTTAAAAVLAAITGADVDAVVGVGTGVSATTLLRKREVVRQGLAKHHPTSADAALACFGGYEMAALVGAIEAAAQRRRLIVLDGFITGVAALVARERQPSVIHCLVAGHASAERGHAHVLSALGLRPLLDLDLRLGEGSGAVLAISLIQTAARLLSEMRTYRESNLERPIDPRDRLPQE
jgi:nicotinate-nucleotide--dimethylbenzimidazole phosphoribosyltransferase